jgi:hypothetical protein
MGNGTVEPWWLAIASGIVICLVGTIGKLWTDHRTTVRELRAELATANATVVELQRAAELRSDEHQAEHRRDLRRFAGISTSVDPPPIPGGWPPVIRAAPVRKRGPPK